MAVNTIKKGNDFRGVDGSRYEDYGTGTSITPTKDGWLRISFTTQTGQTIAPVLSVVQDNQLVGYGQGLTTATTTASIFVPVKAGLTYQITVYRATISSKLLFY